MARVLIVDDEPSILRALRVLLTGLGLEVVSASDGVDALGKLGSAEFDLVITDLRMPRADGFAVLRGVRKQHPRTPVLVLTGHGSITDCVAAIRGGAINFLAKPFHVVELEQIVRDALAAQEGPPPPSEDGRGRTGGGQPQVALLGEAPRLRDVLEMVQRVGPTDTTILITGESGTGKEVVARLIHSCSSRTGAPFIAVNCGAIPDGLLESELFGHARGAFTGATEKRVGKFALAHTGTLFLDEIGELPLPLQVKLLRALQDREVTPVGEAKPQPIDVRIVAATNRDLSAMIVAGTFREDLYYRLDVVPIEMPPLRERPGDIAILVRHFLDVFNRRLGKNVDGPTERAMALLCGYRWPGNVRELENLLERTVIMKGTGTIDEADLPAKLRAPAPPPAEPQSAASHATSVTAELPALLPAEGIDLPETLATVERRLIDEALRKSGGNKNRAAALLGLNRTTLVEKLKRQS